MWKRSTNTNQLCLFARLTPFVFTCFLGRLGCFLLCGFLLFLCFWLGGLFKWRAELWHGRRTVINSWGLCCHVSTCVRVDVLSSFSIYEWRCWFLFLGGGGCNCEFRSDNFQHLFNANTYMHLSSILVQNTITHILWHYMTENHLEKDTHLVLQVLTGKCIYRTPFARLSLLVRNIFTYGVFISTEIQSHTHKCYFKTFIIRPFTP